jgi:hypothetical protein
LFLQQHASWRERLFVTGALRVDRPEKLHMDDVISSSLDASWIALDSTHGWATSVLGSFRLRAAYGRGGGHFVQTTHRNARYPDPRPSETAERIIGFEFGADGSLFGDRAAVSITAGRATNDQGLALGSSSGPFGEAFLLNDVRFRTSGIEGALNVQLVRLGAFVWDADVTFAAQENETRSLPGVAGNAPVGHAVDAKW